MKVVVEREFKQQVGGTFLTFPAGKVINDSQLAQLLLDERAPVIEFKEAYDLIQCPHCQRRFTVAQAVRSENAYSGAEVQHPETPGISGSRTNAE